jgi:hypothetical protein
LPNLAQSIQNGAAQHPKVTEEPSCRVAMPERMKARLRMNKRDLIQNETEAENYD